MKGATRIRLCMEIPPARLAVPSHTYCAYARRRFGALTSRFLILLFSVLPFALKAQYSYLTNNDATITITGYDGIESEVTIPAVIYGYPVTSIGDSAFSGSGVTSVTIPNTVTRIEESAFSDSAGLTNILIGDGVTVIGRWAFAGTSLNEVTIPSAVSSLGEGAFWGCIGLTNTSCRAA